MSNQNTKYFPYHINFDKLLNKNSFNPQYSDNLHKHDQLAIIRLIYKEPLAFYLTEEDRTYYSESELRAVDVVRDIAVKQYETEQEKQKLEEPSR